MMEVRYLFVMWKKFWNYNLNCRTVKDQDWRVFGDMNWRYKSIEYEPFCLPSVENEEACSLLLTLQNKYSRQVWEA